MNLQKQLGKEPSVKLTKTERSVLERAAELTQQIGAITNLGALSTDATTAAEALRKRTGVSRMSVAENLIAERWDVPLEEYLVAKGYESHSSMETLVENQHEYFRTQVLGQPSNRVSGPEAHLGTTCHVLLWEPEKFDELVRVVPTDKGPTCNAAKAARAICRPGHAAITPCQHERAKRMVEAIRRSPAACEVLEAPGVAEQCVRWTYPGSDIQCKCAFDFLRHDGEFVNLKTTRRFGEFWRDAIEYGYHRGQAFYTRCRDLLLETEGKSLSNWPGAWWIVVENDWREGGEPAVMVTYLAEHDYDFFGQQVDELIARIADLRYFGLGEQSYRPRGWERPTPLRMPPFAYRPLFE